MAKESKGNLLAELLKDLDNPPEAKTAALELNKGYYFTSFLEDEYLYHTTYWKTLKHILKEGFLTGNPTHLKNEKIHNLHPNMVCFTTSKWRHLSNLPDMIPFMGMSNDCYFRFPFSILKDKVKPVIYAVNAYDIEKILENGHAYYLATLTQNEDKLKDEYGELFKDYVYHTWYCENEWRTKLDRLPLPSETEVFVSSYYQLKVAKSVTNLPVYIDREIMDLKTALDFRPKINRKLGRIIGKDLFLSAVKHVDVHRQPIKRPDGSTVTLHATLYDVGFLNAITIVKRLQKAGLRVWITENRWKYSPYGDIEVDLTVSEKPEGNLITS